MIQCALWLAVLASVFLAPPQPDSAPSPDVTPGPAPPYAIREAQSLLAKLGYRPGPADGVWGDATRAAFRAFLDAEGLPAAETLTPHIVRILRDYGLKDDRGMGIRRKVIPQMRECNRTEPDFEATGDHFRVTLWKGEA